jgi:hypothetical protein
MKGESFAHLLVLYGPSLEGEERGWLFAWREKGRGIL